MGYTPSAVSQLITAFEKELGLKLFVRTQKGVELTSEGYELVPYVRSYLAREQVVKPDCHDKIQKQKFER